MMLELGWRDRLSNFHWQRGTWDQLRQRMQQELEIYFPLLRRRVEFLHLPKTDPLRSGETPLACLNRVQKAMEVASMGSRDQFLLTYDSCIITSYMARLPSTLQTKIFKHYNTFDVSLSDMEGFATLLTTSESIKSGKNRIAALTTNKKPAKKKQPKCDRCGRMGHARESCKTTVCS